VLKGNVVISQIAISTNGTYLSCAVGGLAQQGLVSGQLYDSGFDVFDNASLFVETNSSVTGGSLSIAILRGTSQAYNTITTPLIATLAASTNVVIQLAPYCPNLGMAFVVAGFSAGAISLMQLVATKR
jgi:hypothetical protein